MIAALRDATPGVSDGPLGREAWEGAGLTPPYIHTLACSGGRFQTSFLFCFPRWVPPMGAHDHKPLVQIYLQHVQLPSMLQLLMLIA